MTKNTKDDHIWQAGLVAPVLGKRHRMRNGEHTGVIESLDDENYPFCDEDETWNVHGEAYTGYMNGRDLVEVLEDSATPNYLDGCWHSWHGGECPVPGDVMVEVELRCDVSQRGTACRFRWNHFKSEIHAGNGDINRFRVVSRAVEAPNSPVDGEVGVGATQVAQKEDGRQNELYEAGIRTHREAIAWAIGALGAYGDPGKVCLHLAGWLEAQA